MGLGPNWASAGQTKGTEILHKLNDEDLIGWWHHWPTGAGPIGQTHPGRCKSVARMGLGPNWASAGQNKGTEILHKLNDEDLIGWWHHWPTGAGL